MSCFIWIFFLSYNFYPLEGKTTSESLFTIKQVRQIGLIMGVKSTVIKNLNIYNHWSGLIKITSIIC